MPMEGVVFTFSNNPILNFYFVLAVLLSGYLLFRVLVKNKLSDANYEKIKELEKAFDILSLGTIFVAFVFVLSVWLSVKSGGEAFNNNNFIAPFLQSVIIGSAGLVLYDKIRKIDLLRLVFFIGLILFAGWIIFPTFGKSIPCDAYLMKMPFYPCSNLTTNQTIIEYCIYECYEMYKITSNRSVSYNITSLQNISGFQCICDIRSCNKFNHT